MNLCATNPFQLGDKDSAPIKTHLCPSLILMLAVFAVFVVSASEISCAQESDNIAAIGSWRLTAEWDNGDKKEQHIMTVKADLNGSIKDAEGPLRPLSRPMRIKELFNELELTNDEIAE